MKRGLLTIIFCIAISLVTNAQNKNSLYADVGYGINSSPAASLIYTRRIVGSFGVGIGAQYLDDNTNNVQRKVLSTDLRFQWPIGNSLLFFHGDAGLDFHKNYITDLLDGPFTVPGTTLYTGLGLGYCYLINKHGMGPYFELKFWGDGYSYRLIDNSRQREYRSYNLDVRPIIALGFKF